MECGSTYDGEHCAQRKLLGPSHAPQLLSSQRVLYLLSSLASPVPQQHYPAWHPIPQLQAGRKRTTWPCWWAAMSLLPQPLPLPLSPLTAQQRSRRCGAA